MSTKVESSPDPSPQLQTTDRGTIARFFKFEENQTNFRQEVLAGVTTFMAMAYILAVNLSILQRRRKPG